MKQFAVICLFVLCMLISVAGSADAYSIQWQAPTTNVDDTPLTDLAGYRLYVCAGNAASDCASLPLCPDPNVSTIPSGCKVRFPTLQSATTFTPSNQTEARTWYVTAEDTAGNESVPSNLAYYPPQVINVAPRAPMSLQIIMQ